MSSSRRNLARRAGAVAAADDGEALGLGARLGDGAGAGLEAGVLEHAHRPVPQDRAGLVDDVAEGRRRARTDVEALPAVGEAAAEHAGVAALRRVADHALGAEADDVLGQQDLAGRRGGAWQLSTWSSSSRLSPICMPLGLEEREAHAAADEDAVDLVEQGLDDAELVADLGAAEHGDERPLRVVEEAAEDLDLLGQEAAGGGRERLRRADDAGVGAVGGAEGIVDVEVVALDELGDEGGVVALLARVEAQVLEQLDAAERARRAACGRAPSSTSASGLPLGRPRWLQAVTLARPCRAATGWWAGRRGCGGRRRSSPSGPMRDVEVGAEEHGPARRIGQVLQLGDLVALLPGGARG